MSYIRMAYHLVFSTKNRERTIARDSERLMYMTLWRMCENKNAVVHRIGGMEDHVHILVDIPPTIAVSDFVRYLKAGASRYFGEQPDVKRWRGWSEGYGGFTVSKEVVPAVITYIKNQKEHHKRVSFVDEYRQMLIEQGFSPDDPYFPK